MLDAAHEELYPWRSLLWGVKCLAWPLAEPTLNPEQSSSRLWTFTDFITGASQVFNVAKFRALAVLEFSLAGSM
jgi:hypothetical protein